MQKVVLLLSVFLVLSVAAISQNKNTNNTVRSVLVEPVHFDADLALVNQHLNSGDAHNIIFLDVRSPEETKNGKIENAVEIDFKSDDFETKIASLDKDKKYIVYCYNGSISPKAALKLKNAGFKQVLNFKDGYKAWPQVK